MPDDRPAPRPAPRSADGVPDPGADPGPRPSGRPRSVVVVGAGLAGGRTVAALRAQGFDGRVTVLGAEGLPPYDRPPLSKELLTRTEPAWLTEELGGELAADHGAEVHLHAPARGLTVHDDGVLVATTGGPDVRADAAVLATGAHAVRPPAWSSALTLHTAADAAGLRGAIRPGTRLLIVGAGWIGAEVAGVAAAAGVEVTVVEAAEVPLSAALGPDVGRLTGPWYERAGVRLLTGVGVERIEPVALGGAPSGSSTDRTPPAPGPDGPSTVTLTDGRSLIADVVLAAVGARPSSEWLVGSLPVTASGAIAVDPWSRVLGADGPLDHVLAVGDLATRRSARFGWVPGGHWDGALRGPETAVRGLLTGADHDPLAVPEDPAPYVFSTQLGHELGLHGQPGLGDDVVLRGDPLGAFGVLWFRPGTEDLTAVLAVDRPQDVAGGRRLFAGPALPTLDREVAADPAVRLRDAAR